MNENEPILPDHVRRRIDEHAESLLWGWDRRLWQWMRPKDALPLACLLHKRLNARAAIERAQARISAAVRDGAAERHRLRAGLYESAARGWRRVIERLAACAAEAA